MNFETSCSSYPQPDSSAPPRKTRRLVIKSTPAKVEYSHLYAEILPGIEIERETEVVDSDREIEFRPEMVKTEIDDDDNMPSTSLQQNVVAPKRILNNYVMLRQPRSVQKKPIIIPNVASYQVIRTEFIDTKFMRKGSTRTQTDETSIKLLKSLEKEQKQCDNKKEGLAILVREKEERPKPSTSVGCTADLSISAGASTLNMPPMFAGTRLNADSHDVIENVREYLDKRGFKAVMTELNKCCRMNRKTLKTWSKNFEPLPSRKPGERKFVIEKTKGFKNWQERLGKEAVETLKNTVDSMLENGQFADVEFIWKNMKERVEKFKKYTFPFMVKFLRDLNYNMSLVDNKWVIVPKDKLPQNVEESDE